MKTRITIVIVAVIAAVCLGTWKSPKKSPEQVVTKAAENAAKGVPEPTASAVLPTAVASPGEAKVYPERSEVVAILHRAREMQRKFQFESALELICRALEIDAHSPSTQAMHRQLVEMLKKVDRPETRHSRAAA